MLNCRTVVARSSDYLDLDLPTGQRVGIVLHLLMCRHCRRFLRQLRLSVASFGHLRIPPLAAGTAQEIADAVVQRFRESNGY